MDLIKKVLLRLTPEQVRQLRQRRAEKPGALPDWLFVEVAKEYIKHDIIEAGKRQMPIPY